MDLQNSNNSAIKKDTSRSPYSLSSKHQRLFEFAELYFKIGQYSQAILYVEEILRSDKYFPEALSLYGDCLSQMGKSNEEKMQDCNNDLTNINEKKQHELSSYYTSTQPESETSNSPAELYFDAMQSPVSSSFDMLSSSFADCKKQILEENITDSLLAIERGDEPFTCLSSIQPDVVELQRYPDCSSTILLYMIVRSQQFLSNSQYEDALDCCSRLLEYVEKCNTGDIPNAIIQESIDNATICSLLSLLCISPNSVKNQLAHCVQCFNATLRCRKIEPELSKHRNILWQRISMERFIVIDLWCSHVSATSLSLFEINKESIKDIKSEIFGHIKHDISRFETVFRHLAKISQPKCDLSNTIIQPCQKDSGISTFISEYTKRFSNRLTTIAWMHYMHNTLSIDSLACDAKSTNNSINIESFSNCVDKQSMLFGLGNIIEHAWPKWTYSTQSTCNAIFVPPWVCNCVQKGFRLEFKYKNAWWLLNRKVMDAADLQQLKQIRSLLRMDDDIQLDREIISPDALLFISQKLTLIANNVPVESAARTYLFDRIEGYLQKLYMGFFKGYRTLGSKMWFSSPFSITDAGYQNTISRTELILAKVLDARGRVTDAIGILQMASDMTVEKYVLLLQLYANNPRTYRNEIGDLCKRLQYLTGKDMCEGYGQLSIADEIPSLQERSKYGGANDADEEHLKDKQRLLGDISYLKELIGHLTTVTLPNMSSYLDKRKLASEMISNVTTSLLEQRKIIRDQKQLVFDWSNQSRSNKPDESITITKSVMTFDKALDELDASLRQLVI